MAIERTRLSSKPIGQSASPSPPTIVSEPLPPGADQKTLAGSPLPYDGDLTTGAAPTFRSLAGGPGSATGMRAVKGLAAGSTIGDFHLLKLLGEGSFGKVFLARQVSLDRQVALKATANAGNEALTLASLEHDHIVQVFTEIVDRERDLRLMCMQYVAGTTLERVIHALRKIDVAEWTGRKLLEVIDQQSPAHASFHPTALRDRVLLEQADYVQAVCWMVGRLAEALDYAHGRGVLHRDIKPANVLISPTGRPMLADFNLAFKPRPLGAGDDMFGGTLAYMSPEHLNAFNPDDPTTVEVVDRRSDIYSLGVVLYELLAGRRPFEDLPTDSDMFEGFRSKVAERQAGAPPLRFGTGTISPALDRVLRCCLDPDPEKRYQTGAELAKALDSCRDVQRIERDLPAAGWLTRKAQRRPLVALILLALLPHALGSGVNISYNQLQIVSPLTPEQKEVFGTLVIFYNIVVYPICIWLIWRMLPSVFVMVRRLKNREAVPAEEVETRRRQMLRWPLNMVWISCLGWFPGGLLFPLIIDLKQQVHVSVYLHFAASFSLSGLIALTYSFFGLQFIVLRVLYPQLLTDDSRHIGAELRPIEKRLLGFQMLAGMIPVACMVLMVFTMLFTGLEDMNSPNRQIYFLVFLVIVTGLTFAGLGLAFYTNQFLTKTLAALRGAERPKG